MRARSALVFLWCVILGGAGAMAQTSTATLIGTVRDSSGAVLPSVSVTVIDTARSTQQAAITNDAGVFVFPALLSGTYNIAAELPGFKKFVRDGITLQVNQTIRIDINLEVGAVLETVEVVEAAPMVETETSSRGSVIDQKKIVELPLNGRIDEQRALQFRTEFFNAFNHANFNPPDIRLDATTFGRFSLHKTRESCSLD